MLRLRELEEELWLLKLMVKELEEQLSLWCDEDKELLDEHSDKWQNEEDDDKLLLKLWVLEHPQLDEHEENTVSNTLQTEEQEELELFDELLLDEKQEGLLLDELLLNDIDEHELLPELLLDDIGELLELLFVELLLLWLERELTEIE